MNKELTPLEALTMLLPLIIKYPLFQKNYDIIEEALKALEIIKEKISVDFNDSYLGFKNNYYIIVNHDLFGAIKVDKERFYLLKEVLL